MNVRVIVFWTLLFLAAPLLARDKSDVVVMKNGDHLTGEIKGLDSGVLYVNMDYILGTSSVQWSKVDHLESKQLFIVKTEDGSVYSGTLSTAEESRPVKIEVIESPEKTTVLERKRVVQMHETSEHFWQRFNGEIDSGIIYSKGNQSTQYSLSSNIEYPRERWAAAANYSSSLSASSGTNASTRNQGGATVMRLLPWNNWFYEGLGVLLQSSVQEINLQTSLGAGVGRYLKNTNRSTVTLLGGFAWQNTKYQPTATTLTAQNTAAGVIATQVKFFRFNKTNLTVTGSLFPALNQPGRLRFNTNATYYVKVFSNLTWNVSFYGNWDNQPPANFPGSDYGTSSGLGWTFGTR